MVPGGTRKPFNSQLRSCVHSKAMSFDAPGNTLNISILVRLWKTHQSGHAGQPAIADSSLSSFSHFMLLSVAPGERQRALLLIICLLIPHPLSSNSYVTYLSRLPPPTRAYVFPAQLHKSIPTHASQTAATCDS